MSFLFIESHYPPLRVSLLAFTDLILGRLPTSFDPDPDDSLSSLCPFSINYSFRDLVHSVPRRLNTLFLCNLFYIYWKYVVSLFFSFSASDSNLYFTSALILTIHPFLFCLRHNVTLTYVESGLEFPLTNPYAGLRSLLTYFFFRVHKWRHFSLPFLLVRFEVKYIHYI